MEVCTTADTSDEEPLSIVIEKTVIIAVAFGWMIRFGLIEFKASHHGEKVKGIILNLMVSIKAMLNFIDASKKFSHYLVTCIENSIISNIPELVNIPVNLLSSTLLFLIKTHPNLKKTL